MLLYYLKAIHIVGFVAWFSGLFYFGRLLVYQSEGLLKEEPERSILSAQYSLMAKRLYYIIAYPAMTLTLICGIGMLIYNPDAYMTSGWMHIKLTLIFILVVYHHVLGAFRKKLEKGISPMSPFGLRLMNEVPTILLVGIVFLAVFKNSISVVYGIAGLMGLMVIIFVAAKLYRSAREKKE